MMMMMNKDSSVTLKIVLLINIFVKSMAIDGQIRTDLDQDKLGIVLDDEAEELPKADSLSMFEHGVQLAGKSIGLLTSQGIISKMISSLTAAVKRNGNRSEAKRDKIDITGPVTGILDQLLKLLRLNSNSKLQAVALNAVVFIAQMIESSLSINDNKINNGNTQTHNGNVKQEKHDGSPLSWMLENMPEDMKENLVLSRQKSLPEQIMSTLEHNPDAGNCMRHLVCRIAPIIWGMQKATHNLFIIEESRTEDNKDGDEYEKDRQDSDRNQNNNPTPLQSMFSHMPTIDQYTKQMIYCKESLPPCTSKR